MRQKTTVKVTYNLLLKEVTAVNRLLAPKKQWSLKQRRKLVSEKIYPKYKDSAKVKITDLHSSARWHLDRGHKKKTTPKPPPPPVSYNYLLKEVSEANRQLQDNKQLALRERRALIKDKIYPRFKGERLSGSTIKKIATYIHWLLSRLKAKEGCDVLDLPKETLSNIDYFVIDEYISGLPDCIYVKVNGNGFGETKIFYTGDYDYYANGVAEITNKINAWIRNKTSKHGVYPAYDGIIQVRPGKTNDGQPDSYYVEFILKGGKEKIDYEEIVVPKITKVSSKVKKEEQQIATAKRIAREKIAALQKEKTQYKQIKKRFVVEIASFNEYLQRAIKAKDKINPERKQRTQFKSEKKKIDKYLKNEKITKAEYDIILTLIRKGYDQ